MPDDGGPAFPIRRGSVLTHSDGRKASIQEDASPGMSLRDWFAGQVTNPVPTTLYLDRMRGSESMTVTEWATRDAAIIAEWCGMVADAMIAERAKRAAGEADLSIDPNSAVAHHNDMCDAVVETAVAFRRAVVVLAADMGDDDVTDDKVHQGENAMYKAEQELYAATDALLTDRAKQQEADRANA